MITRLAALAALQAADVVSTLAGLARGYIESGILARPGLAFGILGLIGLPLIGLAIQLVVLARMPRRFVPAGWAVVLGVAAIPVANNLLLIVRAA